MKLEHITIMARPEIPLTLESIAAAKRINEQERADCTRQTGLQFDADGHPVLPPAKMLRMLPVLTEGVELETRVACAEAVDGLIETFGWSSVLRSMRLVAAVNGLYLRVTTEDEADR